jgi:hypothetical protein
MAITILRVLTTTGVNATGYINYLRGIRLAPKDRALSLDIPARYRV